MKNLRDAVEDFPWPVLIKKVDVEGSVPRSECDCPMARAIIRMTAKMGHKALPSVGRGVVLMHYPHEVVRYVLDANARAMVDHFDHSGAFPNVSITLKAPPPALRLGARTNRSAKSRRRGPHATTNPSHPYRPPTRHVKMHRLED